MEDENTRKDKGKDGKDGKGKDDKGKEGKEKDGQNKTNPGNDGTPQEQGGPEGNTDPGNGDRIPQVEEEKVPEQKEQPGNDKTIETSTGPVDQEVIVSQNQVSDPLQISLNNTQMSHGTMPQPHYQNINSMTYPQTVTPVHPNQSMPPNPYTHDVRMSYYTTPSGTMQWPQNNGVPVPANNTIYTSSQPVIPIPAVMMQPRMPQPYHVNTMPMSNTRQAPTIMVSSNAPTVTLATSVTQQSHASQGNGMHTQSQTGQQFHQLPPVQPNYQYPQMYTQANSTTTNTVPSATPGNAVLQTTPLDPNVVAHMDANDRLTASTHALLEQLTLNDGRNMRRDEIADILRSYESYTRSQRRGPNVALPQFSGDANESFENFAKEIEERFFYLGWGEDNPNRVSILPTLLKDLAKMKYREFPAHVRNNYTATMDSLRKVFGLESKSAMHVYQQLERSQGPVESVHDYSKALLKRIQDSNITDQRFMLAAYLKGLKAAIRAKVILMNPQNMQEAQHAAETVETSLKIENVDENVKNALTVITDQMQEDNKCTRAAINALRSGHNVSFNEERNRPRERFNSRDRNYRRSDSYERHNRGRYDQNRRNDRSYDRYRNRDHSYDRNRRDHSYGRQRRESSYGRYSRRDQSYDANRSYERNRRSQSYDRDRRQRSFSRDRRDHSYDRNYGRSRREGYENRKDYRDNGNRDRMDRNTRSPYRSERRSPTPYRASVDVLHENGVCSDRNCQMCNKGSQASAADMNEVGDYRYCHRCKESHREGRHTRLICYKCGEEGHIAARCPDLN